MDSTAASAALATVAAAGLWQGIALFTLAGDPVPYYAEESKISTEELLRDWRRMYPPAKSLQASLVVLGATTGATTGWGLRGSNSKAAAAFGVMVATNCLIFGYTLRKIIPLNNRLLPEGGVEKTDCEAGIRRMLKQWGEMHAVRTLLGGVALGAALYGTHALLTSK